MLTKPADLEMVSKIKIADYLFLSPYVDTLRETRPCGLVALHPWAQYGPTSGAGQVGVFAISLLSRLSFLFSQSDCEQMPL